MGIDNDGYLFGEPDHEISMDDYYVYLVLIGFISELNISNKEKKAYKASSRLAL